MTSLSILKARGKWAWLFCLALMVWSCGPSGPTEKDQAIVAVRAYANALHDSPRPGQSIYTPEKQLAGLKRAYAWHADSVTGISEQQFISQVTEDTNLYLQERDLGQITFSPYGSAWIYASQMENGAWVEYLSMSEDSSGEPVLHTRFRFGYHAQTFEDIIPGIFIYMLGSPLGKIYSIELGGQQERPRNIIREVQVDFFLVRVQEGEEVPTFRVQDIQPVPGTEIIVKDDRLL